MWVTSRIATLKTRARQMSGRIAEVFRRSKIQLPNNGIAWGQFINEGSHSNQYGLYGTSAAVQVIATEEGSYLPVRESLRFLHRATTLPDGVFASKGDLDSVYKLCFLADAQWPTETDLDTDVPAMEMLRKKQIPGRGWTEFAGNESVGAYPHALATAMALLALHRYRKYRASTACETALMWLCERLQKNGSLRPYEWALALIALARYRSTGPLTSQLDETITLATERVRVWVRANNTTDPAETAAYHYVTESGDRHVNKYLFFLPHCLAAIALLTVEDKDASARRYVLRVVDVYTKRLQSSSVVAAVATGRSSGVDHLWVYRLFRLFLCKKNDALSPSGLSRLSDSPIATRIAVAAVFGLAALALGYVTATMEPTFILVRIAVGLAASAFGALFGRVLWEYFLKGSVK